MPGGLFSEALSFAPSNATLLALLAVPPTLMVLYVYCFVEARRSRPGLALGKLETIELERAVLLYGKAARRREEIFRERTPAGAGLRAWYRGRAEFRRTFGKELAELEAYARDLRATIIRLRGRPIRRYKSWMSVISSRSALARSLGGYGAMLALLVASSCCSESALWAPGASASFDTFVLWQATEGRLLLANWMAASLAAAATPLLYVARRLQLQRRHAEQIRILREFAAADPDRLIGQQRQGDEDEKEKEKKASAEEAPAAPLATAEDTAWFAVLGVSPSATIEDVKQAYKALVKQNHPDRVHNMSPVFRELAEAETKKLNIAYAEALTDLQRDDLGAENATCPA